MNRLPRQRLEDREWIAGIIFLTICFALGLFFAPQVGTSVQAPLIEKAAAPWIFGPVQILLLYFPSWFGAILFPGLIVVILISLPWIAKRFGEAAGRWIFIFLNALIIILLVIFLGKQ